MAFLAPYMLWGSLAASIPIALHFFFRSRYRTVPWAAMKFLLTSIEQTSRRLKFQELLLLMVRVTVLVVLALALARPLSTMVRGAGQGEAVDAVFVFDTSYSMDGSDGAKTRLQRAQDAALSVLDQLPPHSTVQIVSCAERANLLGPRSPANLDQARVIIQELKTTSQATDLAMGAVEAAGVLKRAQASNKELYVFSDMQKLGWDQQAGKLKTTMQEIKEKATISLVRCGTKTLKNAAIVDISSPAGIPRPGERVDFAVMVKNTGKEPVENLEVSLMVDNESKNGDTQVVPKLEAGETRAVTMTGKLEKSGLRVLTAQLKHDDLPGDNRFDRVIPVRDQVHFLIVDGNYKEKADEAPLSSSYFLHHALVPVKDISEFSKYYLQPQVIGPRLASPGMLNRKEFCVLVNVPMPSEDKTKGGFHQFLEELARFVKDGHSVLIFGGDNVNPKAYNRILGDMYGLLPLPIKQLQKFDIEKAPVRINRATFNLPAYMKFKEDDFYKDFSNIPVLQAFEVEELKTAKKEVKKDDNDEDKKETVKEKKEVNEDNEPAEKEKKDDPLTIALRYSNGMPAVISKKVGAGEIIMVTTAAELGMDPESLLPTWSYWPLNKFYGPFLQVTVNHLLHGTTQEYNIVAGQSLRWYPTEKLPRAYTLLHPDGTESRLGVPEKIEGRAVVTTADFPTAGVYRMETTSATKPNDEEPEEGKEKKVAKESSPLGVIADLRESEDLEGLSDMDIDKDLGFSPRHLQAGAAETQETGADRLNREWTPLLLTLLLILALGESLLAWWCGRAW